VGRTLRGIHGTIHRVTNRGHRTDEKSSSASIRIATGSRRPALACQNIDGRGTPAECAVGTEAEQAVSDVNVCD